jgi:hypothetical protein
MDRGHCLLLVQPRLELPQKNGRATRGILPALWRETLCAPSICLPLSLIGRGTPDDSARPIFFFALFCFCHSDNLSPHASSCSSSCSSILRSLKHRFSDDEGLFSAVLCRFRGNTPLAGPWTLDFCSPAGNLSVDSRFVTDSQLMLACPFSDCSPDVARGYR